MSEKRGLGDNGKKNSKKRPRNSNPMTPSTQASTKPERSMLNDGLLGLYKKDSTDNKSTPTLNNGDSENKTKDDAENYKTPSRVGKRSKNAALTPIYSTINFDDVGGMDSTIEEVMDMFLHNKYPLLCRKRSKPKRGILLHGPPGCGKTHLARAIAGALELPILEVAATELVCGISGESEKKIRDAFDAAISSGRCILFIDEIDAICPKREQTDNGMMRRMVSQVIKSFDELYVKDPNANVMVIGATNMPDSIDPALRRGSRFDRELAMGIPNEEARLRILKVHLEGCDLSPDFDFDWLAHNTPGYVGGDLDSLVSQALDVGSSRMYKELLEVRYKKNKSASIAPSVGGDGNVTKDIIAEKIAMFKNLEIPEEREKNACLMMEDFKAALKICVPSSKREGFATIPDLSLDDDVGALEDVKKELRNSILRPVKYHKFYKDNNLSSPKGILLFGPKGCGKTVLAKAIASECGINFLAVNGPELLSMYVGESERAVRRCFERARDSAPCVIFFDEFDALCPARSNSKENAPMNRVVNQLLTEADGMQERKQVFLIAATNRIDQIDSAMLRPGRFDKRLYVGLPTPAGREAILKSKTKNKTCPKVEEDLELEKIAFDDRCTGFSGADLAYVIQVATSKAFDEIETMDSFLTSSLVLCWRHFDQALNIVKPSISIQDREYFVKAASRHSCF